MQNSGSLFSKIGRPAIEAIVTRFYLRCISDPMLAHFFWNLDHDHLSKMQSDFVTGLLGGPPCYQGKPIMNAHESLRINEPHFKRRQQILRETMEEFGVDSILIKEWLALEEKLKPLVFSGSSPCCGNPHLG